ncbi:hypothetical protein G6F22_011956 [Rhizopus arrhizus]|nr:hypothetical protein G6F22_011956 [Rhizopus arrhizus]
MEWLGMQPDEGPFYQMQRMDRYREVVAQMLAAGTAYHCYSSPEEVEAMREAARARGDKPRYDGTWRPEPGKTLPAIPDGRKPVVRFKNPQEGATSWNDMVKGTISFDNTELDDLIIALPDGTPTYNFCVVVDDWDMGITHVLRGDDHVNNTPRQINILRALGATLPEYGHVPMILGPDGEKLSKRHGAVNVMEYDNDGYLPEAMINYLARLGWSHGDQELFSRQELIELFDVKDCNSKASRLDMAKLGWVNQHFLKTEDVAAIVPHLVYQLQKLGLDVAAGPAPEDVVIALRERVQTLKEMAEKAVVWYQPLAEYDEAAVAKHFKAGAEVALGKARELLAALPEWTAESVGVALHDVAAALDIGMGKVAQPLRVAITGTQVSPDISHTVYLAGREQALKRIDVAITKVATA